MYSEEQRDWWTSKQGKLLLLSQVEILSEDVAFLKENKEINEKALRYLFEQVSYLRRRMEDEQWEKSGI
jgi:hypothetical protein